MSRRGNVTLTIGVRLGACLWLFCATFTVHGSGSHSGFEQSLEDRYALGKKIFHQQIVCDTCPHGGMSLDKDEVAAILPELQFDGEIGKNLGIIDRHSLLYFVKKRFGL